MQGQWTYPIMIELMFPFLKSSSFQALQLNTTLTVLNLSWNRLGSSSGVMLGNALEGNHTLEVLNVAYNAISDSGAQALGRALRHNKGLRALDISYNDITWRGAIVLAQALEWNDHLRDLQLNGNSIGAQGGRCLMRSLNFWQARTFLTYFYFLNALAHWMIIHTTVLSVSISGGSRLGSHKLCTGDRTACGQGGRGRF
jgi:Ran GTPase-activating protein (RanGAP) involved in mRNA processing and transport